jgi:hypothetical protein
VLGVLGYASIIFDCAKQGLQAQVAASFYLTLGEILVPSYFGCASILPSISCLFALLASCAQLASYLCLLI